MEKLESDKFSELQLDNFPKQIHWKLYRAKQHFLEFEREAATYLNVLPAGPGELMIAPDSTPENQRYIYDTKEPVPARFGLIAGDFFQNLRSVLDYLVWQLTLINRNIPGTHSAFPVCHSQEAWDKCYKRKLNGVNKEAIRLIEEAQPYRQTQKFGFPDIHVLDELTNENKHRQVLFTAMASIHKPDTPVPFPHIELEVTRHEAGQLISSQRILAFLAFQTGLAQRLEVTAVMSSLMDWVGLDLLPKFERFFSSPGEI